MPRLAGTLTVASSSHVHPRGDTSVGCSTERSRQMSLNTLPAAIERLESRTLLSAKTLFNRVNLVSDAAGVAAAQHDANLVNAWGLAFRPGGPWWVADNGTGKSTLYDGSGVRQSLVVN